ncbi:hypothetical protein [Methanoregula boonei]|jgi:hypothetical protein|uniref:hypothetical protein n=1 Tax=Methanoregula boonei TaxID=358766 RepID=UPI0012FAD9BB|nr:hypothetical protein [Methanoregula boonei]
MGKPYDSEKEASAKCRNGEKTVKDMTTGKYHNVRARPKKTKKSSGLLTADKLVPIKHKWGQ